MPNVLYHGYTGVLLNPKLHEIQVYDFETGVRYETGTPKKIQATVFDVSVVAPVGTEVLSCHVMTNGQTVSPCSEMAYGVVNVPEPGVAVSLILGVLLIRFSKRGRKAHEEN